MIRILNLSGNPRQMGLQHGEQVIDLRPQIQASMQARLADLQLPNVDLKEYKKEIISLWEVYTPGTLEMLAGIAESLEVDWDEYLTYIIAYYLKNRIDNQRKGDGCTTWAANGKITRNQASILAKNREENPVLRPLQCLAYVQPEQGFAYLCLTSAGNPGVSSSGVNCAGLAVADTYVASLDSGPGIPRYALLANLLEKYASVQECIDYLYSVPHVGDGTVTLIDSRGEMAVFEIAHSVQVVRRSFEGFIVSTNHFSEPATHSSWKDEEPVQLKGNSIERRKQVESKLRLGVGEVDLAWSKGLMRQHGNRLNSICRHPAMDRQSFTLSSAIYLPQQGNLYLANGIPCQTPFELHKLACS
jgi:isopenicillin-N N-acyltransferase like protein